MAELPQLVTEPGLARPFYTGNARTEVYVTEALRALDDVSIEASTPAPAQFPLDAYNQDGTPSAMPPTLPDNQSFSSLSRGGMPGDSDGLSQYRGQYEYDTSRPSLGERNEIDRFPAASQADEHGAFLPQPDVTRFTSLSARKPPPASSSSSPLRDDFPSSSQETGAPAQSSGRFATFPPQGMDSIGQMVAEPLVSSRSSLSDVGQAFPRGDLEDAAPKYEDIEGTTMPPLGPPPGAARPVMLHTNLYSGYGSRSHDSGPSFVPDNIVENEDDTQLPYMTSPNETSERKVPFGSRPLPVPRPWLSPGREAEFIQEPDGRSPSTTESDLDTVQTPLASTQEINTTPTVAQGPLPPVPIDPDDERELNAAAAREVSRELDSLMYQPPTTPRDPPPQPFAPATPTTPPAIHIPPRSSINSVPPASSPFARARGRVPGSPPVPRKSSERPSPTNEPPSPLGASTSSSPVQRAQLPPPNIALGPSSPPLSSTNSSSFRTPPELPPGPSPISSQRSLPQSQGSPFTPVKPSPASRQGAGMISVAAFRRPAARTASGTGSEPPVTGSSQDVSPLSIRKKDLRGSPNTPRTSGTMSPIALSSPHEPHQGDEFDYISAYYSAGGDEPAGSPPSYTESRARSGSLR
jgi:hypothetical protein